MPVPSNNGKQVKVNTFTYNYNKISRVLITPVLVSEDFIPTINTKTPPMAKFLAIWDTGATNCVITTHVVKKLNLKPISATQVNHGGGSSICNVYLISIYLPNKIGLTQIRATEGQICGNTDVLIGMDIINRGDFAVTNLNGKTAFTFRMPSIEQIDFVKQKPANAISQIPIVTSSQTATKKNRKK